MGTPRVTRAGQLAALLSGAGVAATHDVRELAGRLPAVLVGPPLLRFDIGAGATATWTLTAVADGADPHRSWQQLDALVHDVEALLPIETATPSSFAGSTTTAPQPAYALTYTETVES